MNTEYSSNEDANPQTPFQIEQQFLRFIKYSPAAQPVSHISTAKILETFDKLHPSKSFGHATAYLQSTSNYSEHYILF
jgi:hypothetical protein